MPSKRNIIVIIIINIIVVTGFNLQVHRWPRDRHHCNNAGTAGLPISLNRVGLEQFMQLTE